MSESFVGIQQPAATLGRARVADLVVRSAAGPRPTRQGRMHRYFEASCDRQPEAVALECKGAVLTYRALEALANRFARHLHGLGRRLHRVGLLMERSRDLYVALLGVQKAGAAFVPIDPSSPADRVAFVVDDAELDLLIVSSQLAAAAAGLACPVLTLRDSVWDAIGQQEDSRPLLVVETADDPTAYIIYTSGSSGRPKGVDIAQSSICNFIHVITEIYDVRPDDRVYQGMTLAFDFAIEEVWPTWAAGATLVAGPTDGRRVGAGLTAFLEEERVSLLYCVPTVLSTIERTLPTIRAVMVGGEACPSELVERWAPGRRMLNTYGPTEATVTCTWGELRPGRPVTIGRPVPSYSAVVLDDNQRPVSDGEVGELCIGGPGVARGYLNRPDLTAEKFIPHPLNPDAGRMYRTGDLVRLDDEGNYVYLGRADAEVKIRGHRVDLGEIESVMLRDPTVSMAAVSTLSTPEAGDELAGFVVLDARVPAAGAEDCLRRLHRHLSDALPPYMVPVYLETISSIPMLPSGKVDRKSLPRPQSPRLITATGEVVAPATSTEEWIRSVWAVVLSLSEERVSVVADFFGELGGHSLPAARATSLLRQDSRGERMSVIDLYGHPTVRGLAEHLDRIADQQDDVAALDPSGPSPSRGRLVVFGLSQLASIFLVVLVSMAPIALLYQVHQGEPSVRLIIEIALTFPLVFLGERWVLPLILARLLGRGLQEGQYRCYGVVHFRVWLISKAMTLSPMTTLAGSAFAAAYLRAAGARIARGTHVCTPQLPLPCLIEIGEDVTVGYGTSLMAHGIERGWLRLGVIRIDDRVTVAANCVVMGPSRMKSGSMLREQSCLGRGSTVDQEATWYGSPAAPCPRAADPVSALMADCSKAPRSWSQPLRRRFLWGVVTLELVPLAALIPIITLVWVALLQFGDLAALVTSLLSGPIYVASVCTLVLALRRFGLPRTPVGIHHLRSQLGVEKWFGDKLLELSLALTNSLYGTMYTAVWLRRLGATIGRRTEVATIANIDPDLLVIEEESFVADMASVGSATYCNNHVAFRPTRIGRRAFVGNASFIPAGTEMGDGTLLGVSSVPPRAEVRDGSSWLGSPSFLLPRREVFTEFGEDVTFKPSRRQVVRRLSLEALRVVLPASLLATSVFGTLFAAGLLAQGNAAAWQMVLAVPALALLASAIIVLLVALLKWLVVGRYRPRVLPLWSGFVRRTEFITGIYEAAAVPALLAMLTGTPLIAPVLRLFGAKIGRRCLIETTYLTEFDLVRLGDDVAVGTAVSLQTHLFEDRVMKMGIVEAASGSTLETRTVVLYDSRVGAGAVLDPLSLVMKGESVPPGTHWSGIPAQVASWQEARP